MFCDRGSDLKNKSSQIFILYTLYYILHLFQMIICFNVKIIVKSTFIYIWIFMLLTNFYRVKLFNWRKAFHAIFVFYWSLNLQWFPAKEHNNRKVLHFLNSNIFDDSQIFSFVQLFQFYLYCYILILYLIKCHKSWNSNASFLEKIMFMSIFM